MSSTSGIKRGSSSLLILFVVFVFVLCSLFLILYGANVYTNIRDRVEDDHAHRMSISYITNKIRACDVSGGVQIESGGSSLRLCADPDDDLPLYIHIYHFEDNIMEYITEDLDPFDPADGEIIMAAESFTIAPIQGGFEVTVGTVNEVISYTVSLKST